MLSFVVATMCLLFFETYKRGILCAGSVALSRTVTHYGPRSGFPYYNLTTSQKEDSLLSPTWGRAEQFCGFEPWEPSPIPSNII